MPSTVNRARPAGRGDRTWRRVAGAGVRGVGIGLVWLVVGGACRPTPAQTESSASVGSSAPGPTSSATVTEGPVPAVPDWDPALTEVQAGRFVALALACVHREYPNKVAHVFAGPEDVGTPSQLTPAFYGCFDWHSAVHGHWLLARLARRFPQASWAPKARAALEQSLTPAHIEGELRYLDRDDRRGFERPYGLAWLLQLASELRTWDDPDAQRWAQTLAPLEQLVADRIWTWVPKLSHPIRSGEHSQTGFALGLALDWARRGGHTERARSLTAEIRRLYADDRRCALHLEPSGHDFLSPCLGAADLVRRVLAPDALATWLDEALPQIPADGSTAWLAPARPTDRRDGKLVHLDGLNLSRAFMLDGIEAGLPPKDPRRAALRAAAAEHAESGLGAVRGEHYAGGHWLASFATYLTTRRGRDDTQVVGE